MYPINRIKITRWDKSKGKPNPGKLTRQLQAEGFSPFTWIDEKGTTYSRHAHSYKEIRWIVEGSMTIGIGDSSITLSDGDRLEVPPGTEHWAKTSEKRNTVYVCASR